MIKILHTADWHLRDIQFGKTARSQDFTDSVFRIIDIAKNNGVKYILCAGDILNSKRPSSKNINDLLQLNSRLLAAGVKLLTITGNHDKCNPSWIKVLQEHTDDCAILDIDYKLYTMDGEQGEKYSVFGIPDMPPDEYRDSKMAYPDADILMMHALVRDFAAFQTSEKVLAVRDFPVKKYKAVLLGDIHTHKYMNVKEGEDTCVVGYPGSTELCSRSEDVNKFVALITLDKTGVTDLQSISLPLNKPIIARDVKTPEEISDLLNEISRLKDEHPTILVRKDPAVTDLYARIARIVDTSESILRVTNIPSVNFKKIKLENRRVEDLDNKKPEDFVADYFPDGKAAFALAQALCDPSAAPGPLIEKFIDDVLYANNKDQAKKFG